MKTKIIIIGMGNMGKRHLQAICHLAVPLEFYCYDLNPVALESVKNFCQQNFISNENITLTTDHNQIIANISSQAVVIIASTARGRAALLEQIIKQRPKAILAEKPLCQTTAEYEQLTILAKQEAVPIYLNFTRHMYPFYRQIKQSFNGSEGVLFKAAFPNGLACIGIHIFELMTWLTKTKSATVVKSQLEAAFNSKRAGYQDFYGSLKVEIDGGQVCTFVSRQKDQTAIIEISSNRNQYLIDESKIEAPYTSQISDKVVSDLIEKGETDKLPDIFQSYLAHKILFDYMQQVGRENANVT